MRQYIEYTCSKCLETKPEVDFGVDKNQARGRKYACKECVNRERRGRYKKENRRNHLKTKYGITPEIYDAMFNHQQGLCAICREPGKKRRGGGRAERSAALYVDHDHVSGEVRGLLCHKCNAAVGLLHDDPGRIERAANYIRGLPVEYLRTAA